MIGILRHLLSVALIAAAAYETHSYAVVVFMALVTVALEVQNIINKQLLNGLNEHAKALEAAANNLKKMLSVFKVYADHVSDLRARVLDRRTKTTKEENKQWHKTVS